VLEKPHTHQPAHNGPIPIYDKFFGNFSSLQVFRSKILYAPLILYACYMSFRLNLVDLLILFSSRLISKKLKIKVHKTVIFPVVLYGCETWSLALRERHRLKVF
jgi:hypothetical protein